MLRKQKQTTMPHHFLGKSISMTHKCNEFLGSQMPPSDDLKVKLLIEGEATRNSYQRVYFPLICLLSIVLSK